MDIDYGSISLQARLAIALRCFEDYCDTLGLHHPEVTKMFDYFWGYFTVGTAAGMNWLAWTRSEPKITRVGEASSVGLDDFKALLLSKGVDQEEFRALVFNTENTLFHIFYGGITEKEHEISLKCLHQVLAITRKRGIEPTNIPIFRGQFHRIDGEGEQLSTEQLHIWRYGKGE